MLLTVQNGLVTHTATTLDPARGGYLECPFTVPAAGEYSVRMVIRAPSTGANSVFVNIDSEPTTPTMIWDMPVTTKLAAHTVAWRGTGTPERNQYVPKVFTLTAGTHTLIVRGRERNVQIDRITIALY